MKQAYPVFIAQNEEDFLVYIPDMEIYTEGKSMVDAIEMARDAIGLKGISLEDDNIDFLVPSTHDEAIKLAKEDIEIFDYSVGCLTYVDVDFVAYRQKMDNKMV